MFSVVRNEMYFLPHFLQHYRTLGVRDFWFLDDRSEDGTREFLLAQSDCGVMPSRFSWQESVRPRMLAKLRSATPPSVELLDVLKSYKTANVNKMPLLFWQGDTQMLSAHRSSELPSDRVTLVLAHFKFYPGYKARIADALATKAYGASSLEYRFLDVATRELENWPLLGPRSCPFSSPADLEDAGLLVSHLT